MGMELTVGRPGLSALRERTVDESSTVQPRVGPLSENQERHLHEKVSIGLACERLGSPTLRVGSATSWVEPWTE